MQSYAGSHHEVANFYLHPTVFNTNIQGTETICVERDDGNLGKKMHSIKTEEKVTNLGIKGEQREADKLCQGTEWYQIVTK